MTLAALVLCGMMGCAVGQRPGKGEVLHLQEPTTQGWYYLYLPEDYVQASESAHPDGPEGEDDSGSLLTGKTWPLVVTFHGMKPFDNASSQIREWQQEADRYGFVVIAPQCSSPDLLSEFPLRSVHPGVVYDEKLTLGAMDEVARRVDIDPTHVLSTSWSSGGYLAHFMINRHPRRFTCVAPRQSNFSAAVLDPAQVPRYRDTKVGIFYTENDFKICQTESQEAARWYNSHGFDVTFAVFKDLGHERRPSVAAAFFAQTCGVEAKTPPEELAEMQVKEMSLPQYASPTVPQAGPARVAAAESRRPGESQEIASAGPVAQPGGSSVYGNGSPMPQVNQRRVAPRQPRQRNPVPVKPIQSAPTSVQTAAPARQTGETAPTFRPPTGSALRTVSASPLQVQLSSTIGIAPLLVNFSAMVPGELRRGSFFLWTDNGEPISNGINGQKYLTQPGTHDIEVLMTTADGREYRANETVTVLKRMNHER